MKARRDYGPFGGEVGAGVGPRTGAGTGGQLYGAGDGTRQQYALTERDAETSLDHTWWRKYDSVAGRWTSPDPYLGSMSAGDPQSFNRYSYVRNDPVNSVDPSGLLKAAPGGGGWMTCVRTRYRNPATGEIRYSDWTCNSSGGTGQESDAQRFERRAVDRASELLAEEDCANFIAELISIGVNLASANSAFSGRITPTLAPMIDPVLGLAPSFDQYYGLNEYRAATAEGRVSASGNSGREGDVITYGSTTNNYRVSWNREFYNLGRDEAARQVIHESLHLINNLGDFALAGAASIIATRGRNNPGNSGNFANQSAASIYLNQQIARHCN